MAPSAQQTSYSKTNFYFASTIEHLTIPFSRKRKCNFDNSQCILFLITKHLNSVPSRIATCGCVVNLKLCIYCLEIKLGSRFVSPKRNGPLSIMRLNYGIDAVSFHHRPNETGLHGCKVNEIFVATGW